MPTELATAMIATILLCGACKSAQSSPAPRESSPRAAPITVGTATASAHSSVAPPASADSSARSATSTPSLRSPHALTLASWNLEWLAAENGHGPVARDDAAFTRLGKYATRIDADVIAVQEVEGVAALARVFDPGRYAFYVTGDATPQRTGFVYDRRLQVYVNPDYTALDVGSLRSGADLSVNWNGTRVRLLSVHLKSGCFDHPLSHDGACTKLKAQVPKLEAWIDARANEHTPFAVLGDFNRRLFATNRDPMWRALDDSQPPEADLYSPTENQRSQCWSGQHPQYIDHIVLSRSLHALQVPNSFTQYLYDAADAPFRKQLSDHCPIALRLDATTPSAPSSTHQAAAPNSAPSAQGPAPTAQGPAPSAPSAAPVPSTELVKGNRTRKGERYYHTPDCPHYRQVKVDTAKGEQYFPDEAAARAAGYQRSPDCPVR